VNFDPVNDPDGPDCWAFSAGVDYNFMRPGNTSYVAHGYSAFVRNLVFTKFIKIIYLILISQDAQRKITFLDDYSLK
jgi:hypothetical protein